MNYPRIVVLADGAHDGRAYLREHPEVDFAAIRPEDLQGVPIGKVAETPQFAAQLTDRARELRREAARRLDCYFIVRKAPTVQTPSIGRVVHYQSLGSKDGKYKPEPRAAHITEVLETPEDGYGRTRVSVAVLNPTGLFFAQDVALVDEPTPGAVNWPPRV